MTTAEIISRRQQQPERSRSVPEPDRERQHTELLEKLHAVDCPVIQPWLDGLNRELHAIAVRWEDRVSNFPATDIPLLDVRLIDAGTYAVHASKGDVTVLGIDRHMILSMTSKDAIAFALAHEIGHHLYQARFKPDGSQRATAAEEIFCDRFALDALVIAGYSPRGAMELFETVIEAKRGGRYTELRAIELGALDEHLADHSRWAQVREDFEGVTRIRVGTSRIGGAAQECVPIPDEVRAAAEQSKFVPTISRFLEECGFNSVSIEEKVRLVQEAVPLITSVERLKDISEIFSKLADSGGRGIVRCPEVHELFDQLLQNGLDGNVYARHAAVELLSKLSRYQPPPLLGRLRVIDQLVMRSLGDPSAPAPSAEVLAEVRRVMAGCLCSGAEVVDMFGKAIEPRVRLSWSVGADKAVEVASLDTTGRKASLLFATLSQDFYFGEVIERIALPSLEASLDIVPNSRLGTLIEERRFWERDVSSYTFFRRDPRGYLKAFVNAFGNASESERTINRIPRTGLHPYSKVPMGGSTQEVHDRWSAVLVGHLERYLRGNPLVAQTLIRGLFLGPHLTSTERILLYNWCESVEKIGYRDYPVTAPLSQFVRRHRTLFSGRDLERALLRLGVKEELSGWESAIGYRYPRTLRHLRMMLGPVDAHPLFEEFLSGHVRLWCDYIAEVIQNGLEKPRFVDAALQVLANDRHVMFHLPMASSPKLREVLRDHVLKAPAHAEQEYYRSFSVRGLAALVYIGDRASLFSSAQQREIASAILAQKIARVRPTSARANLCLQVLRAPPLDVPLREALTSILADTYQTRFGLDPDTTRFTKKIITQIGRDVGGGALFELSPKVLATDLRHLLCRKIADALQSQAALSAELQAIAMPNRLGGAELHIPIKGAEALVRVAGRTAVRVEHTMQFFLDPLTPESVDAYSAQIQGWNVLVEQERTDIAEITHNLGLDHESPEEQRIWLHTLHRHVSSLPIEAKAVLMKQILIGAERLYRDSDDTYSCALKYTLDRLFPAQNSEETQGDGSSANWTRVVIECFVLAADPSERGYLMAAMLAAGQSSAGTVARPGEQLRRIFEHLGPAYIKLGQAIHSYPRTPADIRQDLARLKGMAAVPPRWDLFDMIADRLDPMTRSELARVGSIRGAASFNIVATYQDRFGRRGAVSLLRPFALDLAVKGFVDLQAMVKLAVERDPRMQEFQDDALQVLRHAKEMCSTETNMHLGLLQHQAAKDRYEGRLYVADGIPFHMTTARWRKVGDGYRTMDEAPGVTFDDLPEVTRMQQWFKRGAAKVIVSCEIESILSGKGFDFDRHERQYHVAGRRIIALDHGGEDLNEPQAHDRQCLALFVRRLAEKVRHGEDVTTAVELILRDSLGESDYAQRLQKGLLAMSGIMSYLDTADLMGIVATCLSKGTVCDEVRIELETLARNDERIAALDKVPEWIRDVVLWRTTGLLSIRPLR